MLVAALVVALVIRGPLAVAVPDPVTLTVFAAGPNVR